MKANRSLNPNRRTLPTRASRRKEPEKSTEKLSTEDEKFRDAKDLLVRTTMISDAVLEVLSLRAANGGKRQYGDISKIINKYNTAGYDYVTRGTVCYNLSILKKKKVESTNTCAPLISVLNNDLLPVPPYAGNTVNAVDGSDAVPLTIEVDADISFVSSIALLDVVDAMRINNDNDNVLVAQTDVVDNVVGDVDVQSNEVGT